MTVFVFFASLASIVSLFGWAAEKFLEFSPGSIGVIAFYVIGFTFLFAAFLLISSFVAYEKLKDLQNDYQLSHRITHHLRNAISSLQDLEFETLDKIEKAERETDFQQINENDALKTTIILKKLGAKITSAVTGQIKNYFLINGINENIRVVIKSIIPDGDNPLNWEVRTLIVDHNTWNDDDRRLEQNEEEKHLINGNSDFEEILLGTRKIFFHNQLNSLPAKEYKNSSSDWRSRYNATIVVPIKSKPDGKQNAVYYGFLTADSLNRENKDLFSDDINAPVLNIMAHAADAIAGWFIKNDDHAQTLKKAFAQRTGILELDKYLKQNKVN